jgi:hypothetical protein
MQEKQIVQRGDSFDIGQMKSAEVMNPLERPDLGALIQNPEKIAEIFGITGAQANNVDTLLSGGGYGLIYHALKPRLGNAWASGIAGVGIGVLQQVLNKKTKGGQ